MADSELLALGERTALALTDNLYVVDNPGGGAEADWRAQLAFLLGQLLPAICQGRLTTESGVPVSTSDRTSQGTIYFTPYHGNRVSLYNGTAWKAYVFTERSLALTVTSGSNYDVFLYDNAGTLTLELSTAWTNDTTRADALTLQDGVYVKDSALTRRYLGTIRASGSNVTEDSGGGSTTQVGGKRFVWNLYHQVPRPLSVIDTTNSWSYTTATWRQANNASGNKVEFVIGLTTSVVQADVLGAAFISDTTTAASIAVGLDSVTAPSGLRGVAYINVDTAAVGSAITAMTGAYRASLTLGYHYLAWIEYGAAGVGCLFLGDNGSVSQSGLTATIWN